LAFATIDELLNTSTGLLVKKMAVSLAGRAAHEALEWATMDGKLVVDPHGSAADMDEAAAYVREYLGNGATREQAVPGLRADPRRISPRMRADVPVESNAPPTPL
jgi:hypothetical protein